MSVSKSENTRQLIIEKAAPFFNKKGYADTSLSDVTAATGLTKGAIYGNFENKDELALAVYDYNHSILLKGQSAAMASVSDAIEKLLAMTAFYRQEFRSVSLRGGCPVMNAAVEADDNFPALKTKVKATYRGWRKVIAQTIEEGKKQNRIIEKADADKYAAVFIALIEGGILLAKAMDDSSLLNNSLEKIDDLIIGELKK
ncbi:TetR/AcrR family transcriptional regulator [Terrimonas sp. NA20]|uniref:TetR/AcrR family transcriptional regulator n=1 Tax=Terrimonas ginsenosidimutans TaxID=2908004 RepID=A0ABS9KZ28_9BACT|nr:TetR/AcrR family transcriptional regulator [Terrimonas ginsenosidimutans]MCG2617551.1 TetR/AcrR family transcriptional regulator [Terrimonas ginsenosidimutans]